MMRIVALVGALTAVAGCSGGGAASSSFSPRPSVASTAAPVAVTPMAPPYGFDGAGGTWLRVQRPRLFVAVQAPAGGTAAPAVVFVPGEAGLSTGQVRWAARLAMAGYVAILGCAPAPQPPDACNPGPPSASDLDDLIAASRLVAGVRPGSVGVVSISAGTAAAMSAAAQRSDLAAVVADSPANRCRDRTAVPALLLASKTDFSYANAMDCEKVLSAAETRYYDSGNHVVTQDPALVDDATKAIVSFFDHHLR